MMSDIEIAQGSKPLKITEVAAQAGVDEKYVEQYGSYKAKIDYSLLEETEHPDGKLILVTAITPTPAGEGKTTTTVGLADGLRRIGKTAVVVVATVRALKHHGGVAKADLGTEHLTALERGLPNLLQHVENITTVFGLPCVVAVNAFPTDTKAELELVEKKCSELGVNVALSEVWAKGGEGGEALAREVVRLCEQPNRFSQSYSLDQGLVEKLETSCKRISRAICMAKTQYSFSDDAALLGAPRGFTVTVRNLKVSAGAGFIVALTGDIMTMPGLPKVPAAEKIDVDSAGRISGLF